MHRSASWSRVSDDSFKHGSSPSSKEHQSLHRQSHSLESNELPLYDPLAEFAKKEKARAKFAENAVHLIPVVLLLCFAILWFFSNTGKWNSRFSHLVCLCSLVLRQSRAMTIVYRSNLFIKIYSFLSEISVIFRLFSKPLRLVQLLQISKMTKLIGDGEIFFLFRQVSET